MAEIDNSISTNYPTILNGVTYAPFKTWNIRFNDNVTMHETEGGEQEDSITRKGRMSISVQTTCLENVAHSLALLEDVDKFKAKFYDIKTQDYIEIDCRVASGSMSVSLKEKTAKLKYCAGVYNVSFTLEEF